jgi:competence protein ComEC
LKWPLAQALGWLVAGIVAGDVLGIHWAALVVLLAGLMGTFLWKKQSRVILIGTLLFAGGWGNLLTRTQVMSPLDLRAVLVEVPEIVTLEGTLAEAPRERRRETKRGMKVSFSSVMEVERIQLEDGWHAVNGRVYVQTTGEPPKELYRTRRVQVTGNINTPDPATNPDALDFQDYLAHQGIYFQLQTQGLKDWQWPETDQRRPWPDRFRAWAMGQMQGSLPPGDSNVMLLHAMCLGWKVGLMDDVKKPFIHSGTMHIFAISGLHVALIAVMLVELLRGAALPRRRCAMVLIPLLWFYTAATGWQASAMRSAIMMTVIGAGWILERPSNLLNSLAAAALIILVADPQQLFLPGFQLSFMVVLSMGLLVPPIEAWRQRVFQPDPFLPEELRPRWQRWLDWPVRFATMSAVTSIAAWVGSLPLIAYYFHLIAPVSLVANLVVVPLSSLALMASFGSLLLTWCPPVADLFSHAAWMLMEWMVRTSGWFAKWPGAWWPLMKPGPGVFISYYGVVLSLFAVEWKSVWRWRLAGTAGLVLIILLGMDWQARRETVRLTVLDVGGGDALVFEGGKRFANLVIDTGSDAGSEAVLKPYLQSRGIGRVRELLITHGDVRHVEGAATLIEDYRVKQLLASPVKSRSPGYRQLLGEWETNDWPRMVITNGSTVGPWAVLHPAATDKFSAGDDNAVVLWGEFHGVSVLLLSDLGRAGQRALRERHPGLRADIIVTGIPTKEEPVGEELLALVQPQVVVVSCAVQPALEQARGELRERLAQGSWQTFYVSDHGAVTLDFQAEGCVVRGMKGGEPTWISRTKPRSGKH